MVDRKVITINERFPRILTPLKIQERLFTGKIPVARNATALTTRRNLSSGIQTIEENFKLSGKHLEANNQYSPLVRHLRIPHKYDHFHEKTFVSGFKASVEQSPLRHIIEHSNLRQTHHFFLRQKAIINSLNKYKLKRRKYKNLGAKPRILR